MSSSDVHNLTILVIDGNDHDRQYFTTRLRLSCADCVVLEAVEGKSGLDLCESQKIDCVVLDLDLPDTSGFEILVRLVPVVSRPSIAIIVLTHTDHDMLRTLALKNGAFAYLIKGHTSSDVLEKTIRKAMNAIIPKTTDRRSIWD